MTREEIQGLKGRELDVVVAREIFGWHYGNYHTDLARYSSDLSAAWEVVEEMRKNGYDYAIESLNDSLNAGGDLTHVRFFKRLEGNYYEYDSEVSVMHGISICALLAVLGEEE
ncbi:hypothetical protein D3C76_1064890 [compost metagenome]